MTSDTLFDQPAAEQVLNTTFARQAMRKRWCAPEWALFEEVDPKASRTTRYADGVAINLWESRGYQVVGIEIKVSRTDWQKELKQPEKADGLIQFCDRFYVIAPKGVIKDPAELPLGWGHLELRSNGLFEVVKPKVLDAKPLGRGFVASMLRRADEGFDARAQAAATDGIARARAEERRYAMEDAARTTRAAQAELAKFKKFEEETGLSFSNWRGPSKEDIKLAQQLACLRHYGGDDTVLSHLEYIAKQMERLCSEVRKVIEESPFSAPSPESSPEGPQQRHERRHGQMNKTPPIPQADPSNPATPD
jgi:hypothetical protein